MAKARTINHRIHAKTRAKERYDLELNRHTYRDVILTIQRGGDNVIHLEHQSRTRSLFALIYDGKLMCAVYNSSRKTIQTFLPLKCLLPFKDKIEPYFKVNLKDLLRGASEKTEVSIFKMEIGAVMALTKKQELCLQCLKCCQRLGVHTLYRDVDAEALQFLKIRGMDMEFDHNGFVMIEFDHPCPHVSEQGCKIYNVRPQVCRDYDGRTNFGSECLWSTLEDEAIA